jgi:hypothetical protein
LHLQTAQVIIHYTDLASLLSSGTNGERVASDLAEYRQPQTQQPNSPNSLNIRRLWRMRLHTTYCVYKTSIQCRMWRTRKPQARLLQRYSIGTVNGVGLLPVACRLAACPDARFSFLIGLVCGPLI